ncbi:FtsX-like permease family protein [Fulvivirga sp. M361]|uniref:FtsX-like permease family protein n=1 Tax=Fulvivirga sp. M361 TaxID=2594266 RepID=UPI00117AB743|nr:FtsX-like permease family protein [Fulvivirga sp. M361]TRX56170.1 FtsX-like permease family protein [Fulvivirga sp. M361]
MSKKHTPPKLFLDFFRWFCHRDYLEDLEGDLMERFERRAKEKNVRKARRGFSKDVIQLFRPGIIKSLSGTQKLTTYDMLHHHALLTLRNFKRYKNSFLINLTGLSTGLACFFLISLYVHDELIIDKFHENDDQLYQVMNNLHQSAGITTGSQTPAPLGKALAEEIPEIKLSASVIPVGFNNDYGLVSAGDNYIKAAEQYVTKDYFKLFSYKILEGTSADIVSRKEGVAISEALAIKLFNTSNGLVGKDLKWAKEDFSGEFVITGIFETPPKNSTVQFDLVFNLELFLDQAPYLRKWWNSDPETYVRLENNADPVYVNSKIEKFLHTKVRNSASTLFLQRYSERYLNSRYENGQVAGGRSQYIRLLSVTAILILIIACINFINLSTAKASRRLKEIGIKKAIGASRRMMMFQFLSESFFMTLIALILALTMVVIALPHFNVITGKELIFQLDQWTVLTLSIATFFTALLSGIYPAFYLSGLNAISTLKGIFPVQLSKGHSRKGLVVFQFSISIMLILSVIVVYQQITYIQSKNLGYSRENVLYISNDGALNEQQESFRSRLKNIPGVVNTTSFYHDLVGDYGRTGGVSWKGKDPDVIMSFVNLEVGYDFVETLSIEMAEGRSYSHDFQDQKGKIMFNEAAIDVMGMEDPVGKKIILWGEEREIIGVVRDFHLESLYETIKPCFLQLVPKANKTLFKIQPETKTSTIRQVQTLYQEFNPDFPFEYKYLEDDYRDLYAPEKQTEVLSRYFCGIAIIISCLGLFGLVAFITEKRLKEIGIRKILGSGTTRIVYLLSSDFGKMVLIAIIIALPVSYLLTKNWLDSFAYRISLEWWFFAGSGLVAVLVAWGTVAVQTIKAANINPVECLKDE